MRRLLRRNEKTNQISQPSMKSSISREKISRTAWHNLGTCLKFMLLCGFSLLSLCLASQAQTRLLTVFVGGSSGDWSQNQWYTNGGSPVAGSGLTVPDINPSSTNTAVGIDFETINNGVNFWGGSINTTYACTGVRNPTTANWGFFARSLTLDSGTLLGLKSATETNAIYNWGGTVGDPTTGLILIGGCGINIRDSRQYTNAGVITWGPTGKEDGQPIFLLSGSVLGSGGTGGYVWQPTQLSGDADVALINNPATKASASQLSGNNNNGWTGSFQIKNGYLQVFGYNPLGHGNVVCDPGYDVLDMGYWINAANGPAFFEPLTDINSPGTLAVKNGGQVVLHQDIVFSAVTIEGQTLNPGTYSYGQLSALAPADFPAPGSGSIIVGTVNPAQIPSRPVNVYTLSSGGQVTVVWNGAGNATGFNVLRGTSPGGPYPTVVTNVSTTNHSVVDTSVVNGTLYYYVVQATNSVGTSANSAEAVGAPAVAVSGVTITTGIGQVVLSWNAFPGALSYTVQRSVSSLGPFTNLVTGLTTTNYTDVATPGGPVQTLYYAVFAVLSSGTSGESVAVSAIQGAGFIEEWRASDLTSSLTNGATVSDWLGSILSTDAHRDNGGAAASPYLLTNQTPKGQAVVHFDQTDHAELSVAGGGSPVTGLSAFTETLVFRINVPGVASGNWYGQTGITDAEVGGVTVDWGTTWNNLDQIAFGIGQPDTTDEYTNAPLLGAFHVAVLVWDPAAGQIRMTVDNFGTQIYNNAPPNNPRGSAATIHIGRSSDGGTGTPFYMDGDFAEIGILNLAASPALASNIITSLANTYGYTTLKAYITNFTATPNPLQFGQSTTLSWQVGAGETVSITPTNGLPAYVTNAANGAGSVTVTPATDTLYTLTALATQGPINASAQASIAVLVSGTVAGNYLDSFQASDLTNALSGSLTDQSPVIAWPSHNTILGLTNVVAALDAGLGGETPPVYTANGSFPTGTANTNVVTFSGPTSGAGYLRVPATNSILGGLWAYTVAVVFKCNATPTTGQGNWYSETDLVDGEEGGVQLDYGFTINSAGTCTLGLGSPDQSIHGNSGTPVTDGSYHVFIGAVSMAGQTMRLYVDGVPAASLSGAAVSSSPRNVDTMSIAGPHPGYTAADILNGNIAEIDFYNSALPTNQALLLYTNLAIKYNLVDTNLFITAFTATPNVITPGSPVTLNWVISPTNGGTSAITITGIGDVTAQTSANGVGSIVLNPTLDTNYTLQVTDFSQHSTSRSASVDVHNTAAGSLIDSFLASDLVSVGNGNAVQTWTSHNGLFAATPDAAAGSPPLFVAAGTDGQPTVSFLGNAMRLVNNGSTPVSGLLSFSVAIVYQADTENPPTQASQQYYGETALLGGDIGGNSQPDFGFGISSNGLVMFGTGGAVGDNGLFGTTPTLDGNYHIAIGTWGILSGVQALYIDGSLQRMQFTNAGVSPRAASEALVIAGNTSSTANQQFNGNISQISFYNDDLQTNQVAALIASLAAQYGINLTTADAPFSINNAGTGLTGTPGQFQLSWNASFGAKYTILSSTNVALPIAQWTVLGSITNTGNAPVLSITAANATNAQTFYQIVTP